MKVKVLLFVEEKLYIVMELIEGVPLGEHFAFLKEKGEKFSEDRVWKVFIQVREMRRGCIYTGERNGFEVTLCR